MRSSPLRYINPRHVPLKLLVRAAQSDPVPWGVYDGVRVSDALVQACLNAGMVDDGAPWDGKKPALWHATRIARLARDGWSTPIKVDVGYMGEGPPVDRLPIGRHQAHAAHILGHEYIYAQVTGSPIEADRIFWAAGLDHISDEDIIQIDESRGVVWIHALDGSTIGRFSPDFGIDVHTTAEAQMAGAPECLACTHGVDDPDAAWSEFCSLVHRHYGLVLPPERPGAPRERPGGRQRYASAF